MIVSIVVPFSATIYDPKNTPELVKPTKGTTMESRQSPIRSFVEAMFAMLRGGVWDLAHGHPATTFEVCHMGLTNLGRQAITRQALECC